MSDKELRSKLIRLAHDKPEIRKDLLPLLIGNRVLAKAKTSRDLLSDLATLENLHPSIKVFPRPQTWHPYGGDPIFESEDRRVYKEEKSSYYDPMETLVTTKYSPTRYHLAMKDDSGRWVLVGVAAPGRAWRSLLRALKVWVRQSETF